MTDIAIRFSGTLSIPTMCTEYKKLMPKRSPLQRGRRVRQSRRCERCNHCHYASTPCPSPALHEFREMTRRVLLEYPEQEHRDGLEGLRCMAPLTEGRRHRRSKVCDMCHQQHYRSTPCHIDVSDVCPQCCVGTVAAVGGVCLDCAMLNGNDWLL